MRSSYGPDGPIPRRPRGGANVRKRIPSNAFLMLDFNQALSFADAMERCRALDGEGVYWIEEPMRHDDYAHCAMVADSVQTPIQIGEYLSSLTQLASALSATASDYLMLDVDRIGGVSGWRSAAGLAEAYGREVSFHLYPEVSAHLLAATPTAHWLEFVDWAGPVSQERLTPIGGHVSPLPGPGVGLRWDEDAVSRFRVSPDRKRRRNAAGADFRNEWDGMNTPERVE